MNNKLISRARAMARPIKRPIEKLVSNRINRMTSLVPIEQTSDDDIFVVGYPKSGNTWFQNIVCAVVYGLIPEFTPERVIFDLVPDVHQETFYRRYYEPSFFKSHHLPQRSYRRVVYLIRDGRDAMTSYYNHIRLLEHSQLDLLTIVKTGRDLWPCKWHEHVNAWETNPYGSEMMVVRYEDLRADPAAQMRRFCEFARIDRPDRVIEEAARGTTIECLRLQEARFGHDNPEWPSDKTFFRKGVVGSHKEEMPCDVLEAFLAEAGPTLQRNGYK